MGIDEFDTLEFILSQNPDDIEESIKIMERFTMRYNQDLNSESEY